MPREDDIRRIVAGGRERGLSDDDIRALVKRYDERGATAMQPSHEPAEASHPGEGPFGVGFARRLVRQAPDTLPTVGAMGGAALGSLTSPVTGPVGPVAGAALGGGAGKALQSLAKGESPDTGDVVREGLMQGTLQSAGPVVNAIGSGLYKGGVALLPKALKQEFPGMAKAGYREGIALTSRGADKAGRAIKASARKADSLIADAELGGASPVSPREVIRELRPVANKAQRGVDLGLPDETPAIAGRARAFRNANPGGIPLTRAQELKREAQDLASQAYRARDRGATVNNTDLLMNEGMARGLRQGIENRVPGVDAVNARTEDLIGLGKAATHASQTGHVLSRLGGSGVGMAMGGAAGLGPAALGAAGGMMLTTPGGLTAAGTGLKALVPAISHLPTATRIAILSQLLAEEEQ